MAYSWSAPILVSDLGDGHAHYRGDREPGPLTGVRIRVMCGRLIDPAPLVAPIGSQCRDCAAALRVTRAAGGASSSPPRHRPPPTTGSWRASWTRFARGRRS